MCEYIRIENPNYKNENVRENTEQYAKESVFKDNVESFSIRKIFCRIERQKIKR